MKVYRITSVNYASRLSASGSANRWNNEKQYVIYASSSRSLVVLELVAHRNAIMQGMEFKMVIIDIPDENKFSQETNMEQMPRIGTF